MKRDRLYISTISDVAEDEATHAIVYHNRSASAARRYGFGLELAEYCLSDNMDDDTRVKSHFENNIRSVKHTILHAPYNELFPHAIDSRIVCVAHDRYKAALGICRKAGCEKMVVHANFVPDLYHPLWFVERQIRFWRRFLERNDSPVTICLENVLETDPHLLTDIVKGVADKRLRICLDVGHANLSPVKADRWIEECGKYISHFHLHNNDGPNAMGWACLADTHNSLNRGTIDMEQVIYLAEHKVPDATFTLETVAMEESAQWLTEKGLIEDDD